MGGLFAVSKGSPPIVRIVDRVPTTGLWQGYNTLARAIYHGRHMIIYFYGADGVSSIVSESYKEVHDVRFQFGQVFVVSTATNEVVQLDTEGKLSYRWKFPGQARFVASKLYGPLEWPLCDLMLRASRGSGGVPWLHGWKGCCV